MGRDCTARRALADVSSEPSEPEVAVRTGSDALRQQSNSAAVYRKGARRPARRHLADHPRVQRREPNVSVRTRTHRLELYVPRDRILRHCSTRRDLTDFTADKLCEPDVAVR